MSAPTTVSAEDLTLTSAPLAETKMPTHLPNAGSAWQATNTIQDLASASKAKLPNLKAAPVTVYAQGMCHGCALDVLSLTSTLRPSVKAVNQGMC